MEGHQQSVAIRIIFGMLEENLIFCSQERIDHFWKKKITKSEFLTVNQDYEKINLSQFSSWCEKLQI
jgi:hypothetical protein